jgi:hypothetical protein
MAEERPGVDLPGDAGAERALIASAGYILQDVAKAARGFAMYLPNNPLHEKFFEELRVRVEGHLEEFGALRYDIEHDSIRALGETVYTNPELRENLAFRMYADGIRSLVIDEGLEPRELRALVDIIGRPPADEDQDDVVTRLWGAELPHVTYYLAEAPLTGDVATLGLRALGEGGGGLVGARESQEGAIRRFATELGEAPPPPSLALPVPQQIFTLTEEELASLQGRMIDEERRAPIVEVAAILEAILGVEQDPAVFGELVEIIGRLCGDLLLTGRAEHAVSFLDLINRVGCSRSLDTAFAGKIGVVRREIVSPDVLGALAKMLAQGDGIDRDVLRALIAQLGSAAVSPFCQILGEVPGKETRKLLIESLAETGRTEPELFFPFLADERWYLVRNTVYILRRIGTPAATPAVRRCLGHHDVRVRKEVLHYFEEVPDPSGEAVMIRLLDDAVPALRMSAARSLARRRSRSGFDRLLALTTTPAFEARDLEERVAVWEALGELAPAQLLPVFRDMLLKRRLFAAAKELDDVACAAAGLRRMDVPEALALLREAAAAKKGKARQIIEEAVRAVQMGAGAPGKHPHGGGHHG